MAAFELTGDPAWAADARTALNGQDSTAKSREAEHNAWSTTLPKSIRDSIRARGNRSLPRGYEDRLKAYFEELE